MSSHNNPAEIAALFLTVESVIVGPIATLSSMLFIYGMYIIISSLCMHVLYHRDRTGLRLYLICTILLFAFGSLYMAFTTFGLTRQVIIGFHAEKTQDFKPLINYLGQDRLKVAWA
ncbi:hypothetical protein PQX77_013432, partial [Marasmius sp. AFHP31]